LFTIALRRTIHGYVPALTSLCVLAGGAKDTDAAYGAYQKGDYATALRHLRPLADQGDARAQFNLTLV
jgi:hypothetical protein